MSTDILKPSFVNIDWTEAGSYGVDVSVKEVEEHVFCRSRKECLLVSINVGGSEICSYRSVNAVSIRKRLFSDNENVRVPIEEKAGIFHIHLEEILFKHLRVAFVCAPESDIDFYYLTFSD